MRNLALPLVVFTVAACGDDGASKKPDAAVVDPFQDAPTTGGMPVKLTVTVNGAPQVGIRVHFQNADSSLVASMDTDSNGVATASMADGGFVTAVNPFVTPGGTTANLYTYAGVHGGDELVMNDKFAGNGIDVTITGQADSTVGVVDYIFVTPCGSDTNTPVTGNPSVTISVDSRCSTSTDILIGSRNATGDIVHYLFAANQTTSSGTVDLSAMAIAGTPMSKMMTFNNAPAGGVAFGVELYSTKGRLWNYENTTSGATGSDTTILPTFSNALDVVHAIADTMYAEHTMGDWGPFASPYTLDVGARMLRDATAGVTFDIPNHKATWTEAGTGVAPEFAVAESDITRGTLYIYWNVAAASSGTEVVYPVLPVEATDYNATTGDVVQTYVTTGKVPGGWNAVRENFFAIDGVTDLFLGTGTGSLTFEDIYPASTPFAPRPKHNNRTSPPWKLRHRL